MPGKKAQPGFSGLSHGKFEPEFYLISEIGPRLIPLKCVRETANIAKVRQKGFM